MYVCRPTSGTQLAQLMSETDKIGFTGGDTGLRLIAVWLESRRTIIFFRQGGQPVILGR